MNFLLEKHADPNLWTSDGWTPLQLAVSRRAIKCAHILVSSPRVKVNDLTIKGTALHIAAKMEFIEMVKLLMDNKANEHLPDNNGDTPIELTDNKEIKSILNRE
jgi:ankyrin repeat protein